MTLPQSYVAEARRRFGAGALFVGLRLSEQVRRARESSRSDRAPVPWSQVLTALGGPDDIYDLSLDSPQMPPIEAAETVILQAKERWLDLVL